MQLLPKMGYILCDSLQLEEMLLSALLVFCISYHPSYSREGRKNSLPWACWLIVQEVRLNPQFYRVNGLAYVKLKKINFTYQGNRLFPDTTPGIKFTTSRGIRHTYHWTAYDATHISILDGSLTHSGNKWPSRHCNSKFHWWVILKEAWSCWGFRISYVSNLPMPVQQQFCR